MTTDPATITGYHAHIYYDAANRETAARLRQELGERFEGVVGRWHDEAVGPHPISMYQFAFAVEEFPKIVPFLMLNRGGLRILVHPETGNGYRDHAINSLWLGEPVPLRFDFFPAHERA
jgi:aromatic ring-cleaving dioxygenase